MSEMTWRKNLHWCWCVHDDTTLVNILNLVVDHGCKADRSTLTELSQTRYIIGLQPHSLQFSSWCNRAHALEKRELHLSVLGPLGRSRHVGCESKIHGRTPREHERYVSGLLHRSMINSFISYPITAMFNKLIYELYHTHLYYLLYHIWQSYERLRTLEWRTDPIMKTGRSLATRKINKVENKKDGTLNINNYRATERFNAHHDQSSAHLLVEQSP